MTQGRKKKVVTEPRPATVAWSDRNMQVALLTRMRLCAARMPVAGWSKAPDMCDIHARILVAGLPIVETQLHNDIKAKEKGTGT